MLFDFTFSIPQSLNPFSQALLPPDPAPTPAQPVQTLRHKLPNPRRPIPEGPAPSIGPRKRGWEPAAAHAAEPSQLLTAAEGYVDTPARYVDVAEEEQHMIADLPPAKRRRTIGSTISEIVNFALRRSETDMNAYHLWRDGATQGISASSSHGPVDVPPPYEEYEQHSYPSYILSPPTVYIHPSDDLPTSSSMPINIHARKRPRPTPGRNTNRHRRSQAPSHSLRPPEINPFAPRRPSIEDETVFQSRPGRSPKNFGLEEDELDDHIDRMGSTLQALIAEGQKALGKDVVIPGDEDDNDRDIDEGLGDWEDIEPPRRHRPPSLRVPPSSDYRATSAPNTPRVALDRRGSSSSFAPPFGSLPKSGISTSNSLPGDWPQFMASAEPDTGLSDALERVRKVYGMPR